MRLLLLSRSLRTVTHKDNNDILFKKLIVKVGKVGAPGDNYQVIKREKR